MLNYEYIFKYQFIYTDGNDNFKEKIVTLYACAKRNGDIYLSFIHRNIVAALFKKFLIERVRVSDKVKKRMADKQVLEMFQLTPSGRAMAKFINAKNYVAKRTEQIEHQQRQLKGFIESKKYWKNQLRIFGTRL